MIWNGSFDMAEEICIPYLRAKDARASLRTGDRFGRCDGGRGLWRGGGIRVDRDLDLFGEAASRSGTHWRRVSLLFGIADMVEQTGREASRGARQWISVGIFEHAVADANKPDDDPFIRRGLRWLWVGSVAGLLGGQRAGI